MLQQNQKGHCAGQCSQQKPKTSLGKDWPKNLFSSYLQLLHRGKDFQSTYITFDIFNNLTFCGTGEKTNETNF